MRHFRILETLINNTIEFKIQYTARFLFIYYWKTHNLTYKKYDDALKDIKNLINIEDYTKTKKSKVIKYHYIDAFKLTKNVTTHKVNKQEERPININKFQQKIVRNKSTFIPHK
jgi:hypothetical protein